MPPEHAEHTCVSDKWSVTCVMREDRAVVLRFINWYQRLGADQILIYFDDSDDPSYDLVSQMPGVQAIRCSPKFWNSLGLDQRTRFTKRQNAACRHGYDQIQDGWILNVDADELVITGRRTLGKFLGTQPKTSRSVLFEPAELVLIDGDTSKPAFRSKTPKHLLRSIYGPTAYLIRRNDGMIGHNVGKSAIRAGMTDFRLRQHFAQLPDGQRIVDCRVGPENGTCLLHLFADGYEDWKRKLLYRLRNRGFRPRMRRALAKALMTGEAELCEIYSQLHFVTQEQSIRLMKSGCLWRFENVREWLTPTDG